MTNTDERIKRIEEIALEKIELEEAILGIDLQIEEAKINQMTLGIMPDTSWLYRAKHALGIKKIQLKRLNLEYEKLKRIFRQERVAVHNAREKEFERAFVRVAKELLAKEEFEKIKNLVNEITDKQNEVDNVKEVDQKVVKKGTSWSKEDEEYLKENYKNATIEELSVTLGRSENSIRSKIQVIKKRL
ncbi:hypothetical protein [Clostridium cuniculi]|uniref:hypothetical protein n=1 Tax=Clostridium cuniculi TaxID=2548455 RepID=UPI0010563708|nr:hypothetical protein [Clostridium cuniculi]